MVSITKRNSYFVLKHSNKEQYLGKKIPKNVLEIKRQFLLTILREKWELSLAQIKKGYHDHTKRIPKTEMIKQVQEFSYYFTHDTNKIEGSSLTPKETYNLLRFQITPTSKPESDMIEAKKHHEVFMGMIKSGKDLSLKNVLEWHKKIFETTKPYFAGQIRQSKITVTGSKSVFPHQKFVPAFLKEFFKWYDKSKGTLHPVELAGLAHFRFVAIHPFGDGNGRISRLIMNNVLYRNGYPLLNIKFAERYGYYQALEDAHTKNEEIYFLKWFMKRYISEYLKHYKD
jgi:Fic family protein